MSATLTVAVVVVDVLIGRRHLHEADGLGEVDTHVGVERRSVDEVAAIGQVIALQIEVCYFRPPLKRLDPQYTIGISSILPPSW